ncbi:MAG: glycosyltransferase [Nitrospiraceae bacterium]|nr:glycosyltransferase [Nitrospiraceae bacterium]
MQNVEHLTTSDRIRPVRGIVLTRNSAQVPFDLVDIRRWIRLNHDAFKTEKVDLFLAPEQSGLLPGLTEFASEVGVALSVRTNCSAPPCGLDTLEQGHLLDVFLTPPSIDAEYLDAWFETCAKLNLPVRLQLQAPFAAGFDAERTADRVAAAGVVSVNVTVYDPFLELPPCRDREDSLRTIAEMNALTAAVTARGVEVNLQHLPFCLVDEGNLPCAANEHQFFMDHQQYQLLSFDLASKAFHCRPNTVAKALLAPLGRGSSPTRGIDERLLPWLIEGPRRHAWLLIVRKLTRVLRIIRGHPKPLPETVEAYEHKLAQLRKKREAGLGPRCSKCALRRICATESGPHRKALPGIEVQPREGDAIASPLHFAVAQPKYYDPIDRARVGYSERCLALAKEANDVLTNRAPTREIESKDYLIEGQWTHSMPGGNRWYSFTNTEKHSTVLTRSAPPFTIAVTFGGGIAEYVGFRFGRHCKLLCPMDAYSHQVTLHVDADGYYVLLRDGKPVHPVEFEGAQFAPERLEGVLEPRIAMANIDDSIVTQTVLLWQGRPEAVRELSRIRYSVLIVTTRYSRRLQAVLLSLANQRDFDLSRLEVVLSYVPGLDATDDVIESMQLAYPELRIVRAPFTETYVKSKGFLINESVRTCSGEWVILLDSDTLVPPNAFAEMEKIPDDANFVASDGRKMLTPETTARILLGDVHPWEEWQSLLEGPGEFRLREAEGMPIGFFQGVRRSCFEKVPYEEFDHFEGADWRFGYAMRKAFGRETRLSGVPVLHLDHGGSQWYGTKRHR